MNTLSQEQRERSDRVTATATIVDLRLKDLNAGLKTPSPQLPLTLSYEILPTMVRLSAKAVVYHVTYDLEAKSSTGRTVLNTQITMSTIFALSDETLGESDLQAFGAIGVLDIVHPYVREIVHNLTARMGLPALVLDVKVPPSMLKLPSATEGKH